jgi:hypothetical protein
MWGCVGNVGECREMLCVWHSVGECTEVWLNVVELGKFWWSLWESEGVWAVWGNQGGV